MKISDLKGYTVVGSEGIEFGTTQKPKEKDLLQKTGNVVNKVFAGKQVGESIGTLAGLGIEKAKGLLGGQDNSKYYDTSAPTPLQTVADVGKGALELSGFKGAGTTGTFAQRVLKSVGLGAGLSGTATIKEGGGVKDTLKSAAIGGAIGGAIPVAGAGLRAIGRQIEGLPSRFVNSALGRSKAQVLQDISRDNVDDFSKYVISSKPIGTAKTLVNDSMSNITKLDSQIDAQLVSSLRTTGGKVTIGTNNFLDDVVKIPEAQGALLKRADVKNIVEKLAPQTKQLLSKPSLTVSEANKLRQLVDKTLGDKAFLGGQLSSDKIILKKFADSLRETVKAKAPSGVRGLFTELSNEIRFRDNLLNKIASKEGGKVVSLGDILGAGFGATFGGGIPGAATGLAISRGIESVPVKLGVAKLTSALTKLEPVISQSSPAVQTAILQFFSEIFSQDARTKDQQ